MELVAFGFYLMSSDDRQKLFLPEQSFGRAKTEPVRNLTKFIIVKVVLTSIRSTIKWISPK